MGVKVSTNISSLPAPKPCPQHFVWQASLLTVLEPTCPYLCLPPARKHGFHRVKEPKGNKQKHLACYMLVDFCRDFTTSGYTHEQRCFIKQLCVDTEKVVTITSGLCLGKAMGTPTHHTTSHQTCAVSTSFFKSSL